MVVYVQIYVEANGDLIKHNGDPKRLNNNNNQVLFY